MNANRLEPPGCPTNIRGVRGPSTGVALNSLPRFTNIRGRDVADIGILVEGQNLVSNGTATLGTATSPFSNIHLKDVTVPFYSEGSFTPELSCLVNPGDLDVTYSTQTGSYVRIGNVVYVNIRLTIATITLNTASGTAFIINYPFTAAANHLLNTDVDFIDPAGTNTVTITSEIGLNKTRSFINLTRDNANTLLLLVSAIGATDNIFISGEYHV